MNITIYDEKIFCIGLNKTGTTSIGDALSQLGLRRLGWDGRSHRRTVQWHERGGLTDDIKMDILTHDVFEDIPWPFMFEELDEVCPNAKFILTTRATTETWFRSISSHIDRGGAWVGHYLIYGAYYPKDAPDLYRARYEDHNREVRAYFANRPGKLLDTSIESLGWDSLCEFVGKPIPDAPFPHSNTAEVHAAKINSAAQLQ